MVTWVVVMKISLLKSTGNVGYIQVYSVGKSEGIVMDLGESRFDAIGLRLRLDPLHV